MTRQLIILLLLLIGPGVEALRAQVASASQYGLIKVGSGLGISSGVLSVTASGGGGSSVPDPSYTLNGFVAENVSVDAVNANQTLTSAQARGFLITPYASATVSKVLFEVSTPGATLTANDASTIVNGFVLTDASGTVLAWADGSTDFASSGVKSESLNTSVSLTAGTKYILYVVSTGTTAVSLRAANSLSGLSVYNAGISAIPYRHMTKTTSLPKSGTVSQTGWSAATGSRAWVALGL